MSRERATTGREGTVVKVTVLYNLPPGTDEAEFVRWRTGEHHAANIARPGVVRADFCRVLGTPAVGPDRPASDLPSAPVGSDRAPYRFVTKYRSQLVG